MIKENPPKKIFVIRSATRILNKTLISLREEFPGCHITVLVPESAKESMEQESQVDEVLTIPDQRRISVSSYGWDNLRKLQENKFDLAIALYNIDHGLGYSNIDLLACAVKAKSVRGYNSKGTYKEVTSSTAKKKFFLEKTTYFWVAANYAVTIILFLIITIALIGEWFVRLPFRKKQATSVEKTVPTHSVHKPAKVQI
tara:strand:- start:5 stop:601 length:597 start_codon:yes stop_codon:yes gene_type:complete